MNDAEGEARAVAMLGGSATKSREAIESIPVLSGQAMTKPVVARAHELASALRAKNPAAKDANEAVRVMTLLARSDADAELVEAMFVLFDRIGTIRRLVGEPRVGVVAAAFRYLLEACPDARRKTLARTAVALEPRDVALAAIQIVGPVKALAFLKLAKKAHFMEALEELFSGDFEEDSYRMLDLPSASEWSKEWLDIGLRYDLFNLVDRLWSLDSKLVVKRVLASRKVRDERLAIIALVADPGCAGALRGKLDKSGDDPPRLDALCVAILDGEGRRALELVEAIPRHLGRERLAALRSRLDDHFAETST